MLDTELLKKAIEDGIVDLPTLQLQIEMNERKKYLEKHEFRVWQGKDGHWYTYLPDGTKERRLIRKTKKSSVEDAIIEYYRTEEYNPTVEDVFEQCISEKMKYEEITMQTYSKYRTEFERFFKNKFVNMANLRIKNVDEDYLEEFIKTNIVKLELSHKAFCGMRILINGIFKYAKKRKYINWSVTNFFGDLQISKKSYKRKERDDSKEIFFDDEIPIILNYLTENPDIFNLGIKLAFYTGIRVGELSSLKYSDMTKKILKDSKEVKYVLSIRRTEIKYKDEKGKWIIDVQDFPKTEEGNRDIIINESVVRIIETAHQKNPFGEYLFMNEGIRVRGNKFNKRLSVICDKLNIPHRTMHKIRKTYETTLIDSRMDEALVAKQMGHTDISTTRKYYYFSNKNEKSQVDQVLSALEKLG